MSRAQSISTHSVAAEVASDVLSQGGSALRAALSGFFAAAGAAPGIIFGPTTLLIGGIGIGVRVFDGRCRQPGAEGKRPRGFVSHDQIPLAARAAVPGSIWAAAIAGGYHPGASLNACVRPGIAIAKKAGASGRATLLEHVASHGPRTFLQAAVRQAWLTQFGPVDGGIMQPKDLEPLTSLDGEAIERPDDFRPPWFGDETNREEFGTEHGLVAADAAGMLVGLTFRDLPGEARLAGFEATVPLAAKPVLRGVPRVAPGTPLCAGARLRLLRDEGRLVAASVLAGDQLLEVHRDPLSREVSVRAPGFRI